MRLLLLRRILWVQTVNAVLCFPTCGSLQSSATIIKFFYEYRGTGERSSCLKTKVFTGAIHGNPVNLQFRLTNTAPTGINRQC